MPEILSQVEMHLNLIGATIPSLRIFLRSFHSGYLGGAGLDAVDDYHARSGGTHNATKGSFAHDTSALRVNVRTSIELKSMDKKFHQSKLRSRGRDSDDQMNDAASDGSANPLYEPTNTVEVRRSDGF